MTEQLVTALDRRQLLTRVMPMCSLACLCSGWVGAGDAEKTDTAQSEGVHKFDVEFEQKTSVLRQVSGENRRFIEFIKNLQTELGEDELVRLLEVDSAAYGRRVGKRQAENSPDSSFATFVTTFRPPRYDRTLSLQITEDTDKVFQLRVTECVWAKVFRDAGLGGRIGHAAVCNMDYYWPQAFNPDFKMERDKTLMQGDDHCNHRYIDTA